MATDTMESPPRDPSLGLLDRLNDIITWDYKAHEGSTELVVTFSPTRAYLMSQQKFNRNVLLLIDKTSSFYTVGAPVLAETIDAFVTAKGITKTLFIGSSKGGYGAMLAAGLCAARRPDLAFYCLSLSPQTQLLPRNSHLDGLPSYKGLMARFGRDPVLKAAIERHPDLKFIEWMPNLHILLSFSELYPQDALEAARLCAPNIRKYPMPFTMHGTMMLFNMRNLDEEQVRERARILSRGKTADEDLAATLPDEWEEVVGWITQNHWVPPFQKLVNEVMAVKLIEAGGPTAAAPSSG